MEKIYDHCMRNFVHAKQKKPSDEFEQNLKLTEMYTI